MTEWTKRNAGQLMVNIATVVIIGVFGLWLRAAINSELAEYVSQKQYSERDRVINEHFKVLDECIVEQRRFQLEILQRLTRIETKLSGNTITP